MDSMSTSIGVFLGTMALVLLPCAILSAIIAARKQSGCLGFFLGLILGPIGVIISAILPSKPPPVAPAASAPRFRSARPIKLRRRGESESPPA